MSLGRVTSQIRSSCCLVSTKRCAKIDVMSSRQVTRADPSGLPVLGASRARVLDVLRAARAPLGVDEVAARVGLHPNTTRFHLDVLLTDGLAERATEERDVPGRPRVLYSATADSARAGRRSY